MRDNYTKGQEKGKFVTPQKEAREPRNWPLCAECEINTVRNEGDICYDCKERERERNSDE